MKSFQGIHTDTNAVKNVLHHFLFDDRKEQLSEEMLLGIGGGIGYGYFTFFYEKDDFSNFFLGTRALWEDPTAFITGTLQALGCETKVEATSSQKSALTNLKKQLATSSPPIIALHQGLFEGTSITQKWYQTYSVPIGIDEEKLTATLVHLYKEPIEICIDQLVKARNNLTSNKIVNQSIKLVKPEQVELITREVIVQAAKAGIQRCIEAAHNKRMTNFGITALDKWSKRLTGTSKDSWITLFSKPKHFIQALYHTGYYIFINCDGYAHRQSYSCFLKKIGKEINEPALLEAAALFERSSFIWYQLAITALSDRIAELSKIREIFLLMSKKIKEGSIDHLEYIRAMEQVKQLRREAESAMMVSDKEKMAIFAEMCNEIKKIEKIEREALVLLEAAVSSTRWDAY